MSVTETTPPAAEGGINEPAAAAATTEPAAAAGGEQETFDRKYVEELRRENADRRTKVKEYEDVFEAYTDEQKQTLFRMVKGLAGDKDTQKKTAQEWRDIAERILAAETATGPTGEPDPGDRALTVKEWEALTAEREGKRDRDSLVKQIEKEAADKGFEPGSLRYSMLLFEAQHPEVAGDLDKAAERVSAYEKGVIDRFAKELQESGDKYPGGTTAPNTGPAEQETEAPTFKSARARMSAWLDAKAGEA